MAFAARADDVKQTSGKFANLTFNAVRVGLGDGYDPETSCFKTPLSGLYHFTVTVRNTMKILNMSNGRQTNC